MDRDTLTGRLPALAGAASVLGAALLPAVAIADREPDGMGSE